MKWTWNIQNQLKILLLPKKVAFFGKNLKKIAKNPEKHRFWPKHYETQNTIKVDYILFFCPDEWNNMEKYNNFLNIQYYQKKLLDYLINISKNEPGFAKITNETFLIKIIKYTLEERFQS